MTKKHYHALLTTLSKQSAECAQQSEIANKRGDQKGKAFQAGASMALQRALDYVKDAQAGILGPH